MSNKITVNLLYPFTILLIALMLPNNIATKSKDETEIRDAAMQQADAWNRHI